MDAQRAMRLMVGGTNLTASELSRRMGRSRKYVSTTMRQGATPSVENFARLAGACGYGLLLADNTGAGRGDVRIASKDDAREATRAMVYATPKSTPELSRSLGMSDGYVANTLLRQGSVPNVATFARLAHECGWKLMLEREDGGRLELYSPADATDYMDDALDGAEALRGTGATEAQMAEARRRIEEAPEARYTRELWDEGAETPEELRLRSMTPGTPEWWDLAQAAAARSSDPGERGAQIVADAFPQIPITQAETEAEHAARRRVAREKRAAEEEAFFLGGAKNVDDGRG